MDVKTFHKLSYGMYLVSSTNEGKINGQVANTVFQITSEPPMVAVSINKQNLTHEYIRASGMLAVAILAKEAPMSLIARFGFKSGRELDKFAGVKHRIGSSGAPIVLEHCTGYLEGKVLQEVDCATHTLFILRVEDAGPLEEGEPMTYAYYHQVKKGSAPATAPTYIKPEAKVPMEKSEKYRCTVCGYIYDPSAGDPDSGIPGGTPFHDLPAAWLCPVCGAGKESFEPEV